MTILSRLILIISLTLLVASSAALADDRLDSVVNKINELLMSSKLEDDSFNQQTPLLVDTLNSVDRSISADEISPFIVGGIDAARNEYPEYTIIFLFNNALTEIIGSCGGTLIAANKVLTAAHCSQEPSFTYFLVPNFYSFGDSLTADDLYQASSIVSHPNYDAAEFDYDVSVITLGDDAPFQTANIHKGNAQLDGVLGTVVGTGATETFPSTEFVPTLQELSSSIGNNDTCDIAWQALVGESVMTKRMMCSGESNGDGACSGDSGGPLWAQINSQRTLVGSVSFGLVPCEANQATQVYARLSQFNSFIASQSPETNFIVSNDSVSLAPLISILLDD